ncbi:MULTISPECIES: RNA-binding cell elongation regulator Jag/EloR [unclassified Jeotgalicoccus]|uniref:RNA-binding cell elongation regulator Jag/EloR n=1 Tax=unclassified Jeotgalicoccus TaxID=2630462 RepID=UPI001414F8EE|nr:MULTISPECIES: RNA-binding cell elongation regulator Jag/EloR [unclassified Jeotgalicoccus]QQD84499.1 protein jag [Jeotgalicoccus sp. ATCC 8456]
MYRIYTEKTVNDAVTKGLEELGVSEDDIKIEVLDSGSAGFLGFGKREAEVKLTIINPELKSYESIEAMISARENEHVEADSALERTTDDVVEPHEENQPEETEAVQELADDEQHERPKIEPIIEESKPKNKEHQALTEAGEKTSLYISEIVSGMGVENTVQMKVKKSTIHLNFDADIPAKIIGKRGQTLNALQELAQNYLNIVYPSYNRVELDVGDYRSKRKETLEALALNMADKVRRTHEKVRLEPMPANERKIMHHALSREKGIDTYSEGKEPRRAIVIIKK